MGVCPLGGPDIGGWGNEWLWAVCALSERWPAFLLPPHWLQELSPSTLRKPKIPSSSVQFGHSVVSDSLWPHRLQHARPPCPSPSPGVYPDLCPLSRDAIQISHPLSSPSPPASNLSQHQGLFQWVSFLHQLAKALGFQLQHQSFQWTLRTDLP